MVFHDGKSSTSYFIVMSACVDLYISGSVNIYRKVKVKHIPVQNKDDRNGVVRIFTLLDSAP